MNNVDGSNESSIQICEDAILNALEASEVSSLNINITDAITIEIGASDSAYDSTITLGDIYLYIYKMFSGTNFVW